jgi:hypothetical protein
MGQILYVVIQRFRGRYSTVCFNVIGMALRGLDGVFCVGGDIGTGRSH